MGGGAGRGDHRVRKADKQPPLAVGEAQLGVERFVRHSGSPFAFVGGRQRIVAHCRAGASHRSLYPITLVFTPEPCRFRDPGPGRFRDPGPGRFRNPGPGRFRNPGPGRF
ncbi:hypothetical protein Apa02nite_039730 [Actinoplanes palleronii]|uniref:Uncharacterized protein n=1 Tax=Actinoplanes palleronii TaxID=113570 RepID=A0ABQ4BB16_9ACTN|nr:hypothetical protein Apa02nite_039730 [Actinoplanes palleronii]